MGLLEDMRAANAERMAINEGKNLIGSKYGVKGLQAFPCDIMRVDWKADLGRRGPAPDGFVLPARSELRPWMDRVGQRGFAWADALVEGWGD